MVKLLFTHRIKLFYTRNMTSDDVRKKLELAIVELLKDKVDREEMTPERQKEIAEYVLGVIQPGMSLEDLYRAIPKLDDRTPELSPVIVPFLREYEERVAQKAEEKMSELIRLGQFAAASSLAEKVIKQNVKLVYVGKGKA